MENLVFTQLSIPEIRQLFRQELQTFFDGNISPFPPQTESEHFLSIQQAAEFLKLSVATIYGLVSKSDIPVNKRGKRLYFSKTELIKWVKEGRKKSATELAEETDKYLKGKSK